MYRGHHTNWFQLLVRNQVHPALIDWVHTFAGLMSKYMYIYNLFNSFAKLVWFFSVRLRGCWFYIIVVVQVDHIEEGMSYRRMRERTAEDRCRIQHSRWFLEILMIQILMSTDTCYPQLLPNDQNPLQLLRFDHSCWIFSYELCMVDAPIGKSDHGTRVFLKKC